MYLEFIEQAESLEDLEHDCQGNLEVRERTKGTGTAYANQCQICGEARGGEISKKKITGTPPPFDTELPRIFEEKRKLLVAANVANLKARNSTTSAISTAVPVHDIFADKMSTLLAELQDEHPGTDITSIFQTYLVRQREKAVNSQVSGWGSEPELADWFKQNFSEWFEIKEEVWGTGYVNREKQRIRIDFVVKAKPQLIELGFTDQYVGVEVKYFNTKTGQSFHKKSSEGVFQALSYWYSGAAWEIDGEEPQSLATVLLFSNLSFSDERESLFGTYDSYYRTLWKSYLSIANHSNVGELQVSEGGRSGLWWAMEYNGTKYFSRRFDGSLVLGNSNVINKVRIGNGQRRK